MTQLARQLTRFSTRVALGWLVTEGGRKRVNLSQLKIQKVQVVYFFIVVILYFTKTRVFSSLFPLCMFLLLGMYFLKLVHTPLYSFSDLIRASGNFILYIVGYDFPIFLHFMHKISTPPP